MNADAQPQLGGGSSSSCSAAAPGALPPAAAEHTLSAVLAGVVGAMPPDELPAGAPAEQAYALPVDSQAKAVQLRLVSAARPHMRAFQLSWVALFLTFLATFAPAALLPVLRDALDLTATDIANAGIASVVGAVFSRVAMGSLTDALGPRYAAAVALLGTAPCVFAMALVAGPAGFIALRTLTGLGLSMFVVNQKWTSAMFTTKLLGRANALAAGWGNMGGGATLLLMPLLYAGLANVMPAELAWRVSFFVPGALNLVFGVLVLTAADDTPAGRMPELSSDWAHLSAGRSPLHGWQAVLLNYRPYLLGLAYALSFGVELTVANVVSLYLFNTFGLSLTAAGMLGGSLGLMNVCSRFLGGLASDLAGTSRGMRGRLWVLQLLLSLEGLFCLLVGLSHHSLAATLAMLYLFCFFCQMACGAVFGIVPFLSHRCTGLAVGVVAAGGNIGSAVTQAAFFGFADLTASSGFYWMGTAIICLGAALALLQWPMWGGMCCAPRAGSTEESYYLAEYSRTERAAGLHLQALAFAHESRSERHAAPGGGGLARLPRHQHDASFGGGSAHSRAGLLPPPGLQLGPLPAAPLPPPAQPAPPQRPPAASPRRRHAAA